MVDHQVTAFADQSLSELLDALRAPAPAPAGGSASAWACALAAGLVEMTAVIGEETDPDAMRTSARRAGELRATALALADRDAQAYADVLAARRSSGREDAAAALAAAANPPLAIAEAAAEVAVLAQDVALHGKASLRGDAVTATLLAEAAAAAAAGLVTINLAEHPGDPRLEAARGHARRAAAAREAATSS